MLAKALQMKTRSSCALQTLYWSVHYTILNCSVPTENIFSGNEDGFGALTGWAAYYI